MKWNEQNQERTIKPGDTDIPPEDDGRVVNASMTGPGGLKIFQFAGEI